MELPTRADLPFTLVEDWFTEEVIIDASLKSDQCESDWVESARNEFTTEEVCWPETDWLSMRGCRYICTQWPCGVLNAGTELST
jgi:hypothetical protein